MASTFLRDQALVGLQRASRRHCSTVGGRSPRATCWSDRVSRGGRVRCPRLQSTWHSGWSRTLKFQDRSPGRYDPGGRPDQGKVASVLQVH